MPELTYTPHDSSNVESSAYDPHSRRLYVRFKGGAHYVYHDVNSHHHGAMCASSSVGGYLAKHIKPFHGVGKLEE